jgi:DNA-binding NtrC family response regulator
MSGLPLARVLVVDDEAHIGESIRKALERVGYSVDVVGSAEAARAALEREEADVVLCDIRLPGMDGMQLLDHIRQSHPATAVIMITGFASIESAVASIKGGAEEYIAKPFSPEQLRHAVANVLERKRLQQENAFLKGKLRQLFGQEFVVGQSKVMQHLFALAQTVAATDSSVLIEGESGTGKEVLAHFIHAESQRKDRPFITVNCAAIPATLLESELFGHVRGAFTGAAYSRRGSFELAHGGTLFLDEIGEMAVEMQAKILRALEARQIQRVGSERPTEVNVRIIAATNKNLRHEIKAGRFREDLYWRLNVVQLKMPPLRERREDIAPLARHFVNMHANELNKPVPELSADVLAALTQHDWLGNVRELRNMIERAVIFCEAGKPLSLASFPSHFSQLAAQKSDPPSKPLRTMREVEAEHIRTVLEACGGNRTQAARILGISAVTLWRKLGSEESSGEGESSD